MSNGSNPSNSRVLNRFRTFKTRFDTSTALFWYMSEFRKAIAGLLQNRAETGCCLALVLKHFQTEFAAENLILNRYYTVLQGIEDHKLI